MRSLAPLHSHCFLFKGGHFVSEPGEEHNKVWALLLFSFSLSARGGEFHNQVWTFSSAEQRLLDARSEGGVEERRLEVSCSQTLYFVSVSLSLTHTGTHRSRLPCLNNKRSLEKRSAPSWIKIFFLELLEGSGFDAGLGGKRSRPLSVRACACVCVSMFQRV